jgi:phospholipase D1/2
VLEADPEISESILEIASVADPERPVSLDNLISQFAPRTASDAGGPAWKLFVLVALVVGGLAAIWHFTPLAEMLTPEHVVRWAKEAGGYWWAPFLVMAAYTPACLVMFPRPLITLFAVMAFGPQQAFTYAMAGVLTAALLTYAAGRAMNRETVRRLAGQKLNHISEVLRRRGLIAVTALRLVPVAPFSVEGVIAGAVRIKLWHYMAGTALGLLPGTIGTTLLGNELEAVLVRPSEANYWVMAGLALFFVLGIIFLRRVFSSVALATPQ